MNDTHTVNGSREQVLIAENKKLKHLLNRMSGFNGNDSMFPGNSDGSPYQLPLIVSQILSSASPFNERIHSVISYLGDFTSVSKVYVFENSENNTHCSNTYEWCNSGVIPQINQLQDIDYNKIPSWKEHIISNGHIISSNIESELPDDIVKMLITQDIKSILIFPLTIGDHIFGFIGLDECSFYRKWTELEKALLATVAKLVSYSFQQNNYVRQIRKSLQTQQFLFDIASILNKADSQDDPFHPIAKKITETWNLEAFALYSGSQNNKGVFELAASFSASEKNTKIPYKLEFTDSFPLPILPCKDIMQICESEEQKALYKSLGFSSEKTLLTGIRTYNGANGIITLSWKNTEDCPLEESILDAFAGMLARQLDHNLAEKKNREHHHQILKINNQLADKESFLNNIILAAPIGILLVKDRVIQYVNDQVSESSQYSREELIGRHFSGLYPPGSEDITATTQFYNDINTNGIASIDVRLKKKNGEPLFYNVTGTPGPGYQEKGLYLLIGQDMTQIKTTENSLIESEERNRRIIEANIDGIFIMSKTGQLVYVNNSGCKLTGYKLEELIKLTLNQLFPEKNGIRDYLKIIGQLRQGVDYRGDTQIRHCNGSLLHVELHGTMITLDREPHFYFSIHDITRRKQNEAALRISEKKFRSLSENIPDCVVRVNKSGLITYGNSLFYNLYNSKKKTGTELPVYNPDDLPDNFSEYFMPALNYVFANKKIVQLEMEHKQDNEIITFDWSLSPEMDESENCMSVLGIGRNITPRKKVEKELLLAKEKAEAADRLKSAFLANMSHEIRTPLNAIVGFTNLLGQTDPESSEREEFVSLINKSADTLMSMITDIVDVAKMESGHLQVKMEDVDIDPLLEAIYRTYNKRIAHQFNNRVELKYSPQHTNGFKTRIKADPARFIQIMNNLLDNAIKFIHSGQIQFGYSIENRRVRFFVRDTGIGISSEGQRYIFDAFRQEEESTSRKYGGTGLGLTICKKLVEAMNGQIDLISEKNKGSEFFFYLDLYHSPSAAKHENTDKVAIEKPEKVQQILPNWNEKIFLLVEENGNTQIRIKKQLEKTHVTILLARSGSTARTLLNNRTDIDVVIMNSSLPDLDSRELVQQLRSQNIRIPILALCRDQNNHRSVETYQKAGFNDCVNDNFQSCELIGRIQQQFN